MAFRLTQPRSFDAEFVVIVADHKAWAGLQDSGDLKLTFSI